MVQDTKSFGASPLMPDKDEYTIFLQHTLDKVMRFQQMYPYINVSNEITELNKVSSGNVRERLSVNRAVIV